MYRLLIITFYISSLSIALYLPEDKDAVILRYNFENYPGGNYMFSYETSNGIKRNETGQVVHVSDDNEYIAVKGSYSFIDPDGINRIIEYTADINGYQVKFSAHKASVDSYPTGISFGAPVSAQVLASLLGK